MKRITTPERLREYIERFGMKQVDVLKKAELYTIMYNCNIL